MTRWILVTFTLFLAPQGFPCSQHPGKTHEEWTSAIKSETNKDGSVKTLSSSSDFFSESKPEEKKKAPSSERSSRPRTVNPY
jgi:hypothetical protein